MNEYDFKTIAKDVEQRTQARQDYRCDESNPDTPKFYALGMFPYPSGNAHMGHVRVYTLVDVVARYKKLKGYQVLNPIGWDAFGLPAENAAIKNQISPDVWTQKNIHTMKTEQFNQLGCSFNWERELNTSHPDYYRWTQWLFLKFYQHGKAYKKRELVNWCSTDQTVLANEQVIDGKCWRDNTPVEKRYMEQWFLKTTDYADALWSGIQDLTEWPNEALAMQKNWIRKSSGALVKFAIENTGMQVDVFTTRIDTLFGVSALILAPEHALVAELQVLKPTDEVQQYIAAVLQKSNLERTMGKEKTGVKLAFNAVHPITQKVIPIYIADYVSASFATGAVMCVPAHDERDWEFAKQYQLAILPVIEPVNKKPDENVTLPYLENGQLINSQQFDGLHSETAHTAMIDFLEKQQLGVLHTTYNLHDWSVSRQRYWGCPIPMVICAQCGNVPVKESDLPVLLPPATDFKQGKVSYPASYLNTACPQCGQAAQRETDTLDTFFCSSWYAFRFVDPNNDTLAFAKDRVNDWFPINFYVGGLEHAAQHMIYFRFFTKFFNEIGLLDFVEPVANFFCNGMVLKDGAKMSKSKGNTVLPSDIINEYGSDALRLYMLGDTPAHLDIDWQGEGVQAKYNFLRKIFRVIVHFHEQQMLNVSKPTALATLKHDDTVQFYANIARLEKSLLKNDFHNVVARWHEISNLLLKILTGDHSCSSSDKYLIVRDYLIVSSVLIPQMTEWLYHRYYQQTGIYHSTWPDLAWVEAAQKKVTIVLQINGKKFNTIEVEKDTPQLALEEQLSNNERTNQVLSQYVITKKIFVPNRIFNFIGSK